MTHKEIIAKFLKAINQWIEAECPENNEWLFTKDYALCANLQHYLMFEYPLEEAAIYTHFQNKFLNREVYPFNKDAQDFTMELITSSFYENSKRRAFIIRHMEK